MIRIENAKACPTKRNTGQAGVLSALGQELNMLTDNEKLSAITDCINKWAHSLETRPMQLGRTFSELDGFLGAFDAIKHILRYSEPLEAQLSWISFCSYKGLFEGAEYYPDEMFKCAEDDPCFLFKKYRKEYREWVEMKIEHRNNPIDSRLTELLKQANDIEANLLVPWFSEYPSNAAIEIYRTRINRRYVSEPTVAIGLAKMGDEKVFAWAKKNVIAAKSKNSWKIALNCIASSPLDEADIILQGLIASGNIGDIRWFIDMVVQSKNINKIDRLRQIVPKVSGNEYLSRRLEKEINNLKEHKS